MSKLNLKFDKCHANQSNPNNHQFWRDRGFAKRPDDWKERYSKLKGRTSSKVRQGRRDDCEFSFIGFDAWGPLPADGFGRLSSDDY